MLDLNPMCKLHPETVSTEHGNVGVSGGSSEYLSLN